jgi:hypothetical protein
MKHFHVMTMRILAVVLGGTGLCVPALAEDAPSSGWRHTLGIYGMGAAIEGTAQIADLKAPIDVSISELFDALEMGGMAAYRGENDTWSIMGDVTYMGLGGKATSQAGRLRADLDVDQLTVMATLGRRVSPTTEVLFSLAYFDLSADVEVRRLDQSRKASTGVDWIDPSIGLRYEAPLSEKWSLVARGDVGGFGIGSDLLVHGALTLHRHQSDFFGWFVGYRVIAFDYEEGQGRNYKSFDQTEQGPGAGITFRF